MNNTDAKTLAISALIITFILIMVLTHVVKGLSIVEIKKSPILAAVLFISICVMIFSYLMFIKTGIEIYKRGDRWKLIGLSVCSKLRLLLSWHFQNR